MRLILSGRQWDEAVVAARIQPKRAIVLLQQLHREGLLRRDLADRQEPS